MFLDTGARINLISLDFLRKVKPGLVIIEPNTYNIRGVTGNDLTPIGETQITVTFGNYYKFDLTAVVVEQQSFPGNLLIGYDTMREEDITIIPAKEGVKLSYKFLPFINTHNKSFVAPVSQQPTTEANTVPLVNNTIPLVNNVAERYLNNSSPVPDKNQIPKDYPEKAKSPLTTKQNKHHDPTESSKIVSGSVTESTLLQAQSICKVEVSLKGISDHVTAIALSESSLVRGINLENGLYHTNRGSICHQHTSHRRTY